MSTKTTRFNKIISLILVFCMIFSMIPNIFAANSVTYYFKFENIWQINTTQIEKPNYYYLYVYGTNTEGDTENGTRVFYKYFNSDEIIYDENNTNISYFSTSGTNYDYYYLTFGYNYDDNFTQTTVMANLTEGEEYNEILSQLGGDTSAKVLKFTSTHTAEDKLYNIKVNHLWNDEDNSNNTRPEQIKINILSGPYSADKVTASYILTNEKTSSEDTNLWISDIIEARTPFKYIEAEVIYGDIETNYITDISEITLIDEATDSYQIDITSTEGIEWHYNIYKYWNDAEENTAERFPVNIKIYGTNNKQDAENKTNGTLLVDTVLTSEDYNYSNQWNKSSSLILQETYNYYYVTEEFTQPDGLNKTYSNSKIEISGYEEYMYTYIYNTAESNQTVKVTHTWDDNDNELNLRPESITLQFLESSWSENVIGEIELTAADDINNDNDPNTWEFEFPFYGEEYGQYFYAKIKQDEVIGQTYKTNVGSSSFDKTNLTYNIALKSSNTEYNHQSTITVNWEDENNYFSNRPQSVTLNVYGGNSVSAYGNNLGKLLDTITITEDNILESDTNSWKIITPVYTTPYEYIVFKLVDSGFENYSSYISNKYTSTVNNIKQYNTTLTYTSESIKEISVRVINNDSDDLYNERPSNYIIKLYGTNIEDATSGGTLITTDIDTIASSDGYKYIKAYLLDQYESYYIEVETTETTHGTYKLISQSYYDDRIVLYMGLTNETVFNMKTSWEDKVLPEGSRPEEIKLHLYGGHDSSEITNFIKTITLSTEDILSENIWKKQIIFENAYSYFKIIPEFDELNNYNFKFNITEKTLVDETVLEYDIETIFTALEEKKNIELNITKTWDDNNNENNNRPETFDIELYGTYKENDFDNEKLIKTITINKLDDLNNDNDPNTWEINIKDIETSLNYFYIKEKSIKTEFGTYSLTQNNVEKTENTISSAEININQILNEEYYGISPMASRGSYLTIEKIWNDNNETDNRPEYIILNFYKSDATLTEKGQLAISLKLYEDQVKVIENHSDFYYFEMEGPWKCSGATDEGHAFDDFWIEEEGTGEYYWLTTDVLYENWETTYTLKNMYIDHPVYNVKLTNTFEKDPYKYNFNVTKDWIDLGFETNRPESIELNIYGTNNQKDAQNKVNGTLLKTDTITSEAQINDNTWQKTITVESLDEYAYFYILEAENEKYSESYSSLIKESTEGLTTNYSQTITNSYKKTVQFKATKTWVDEATQAHRRNIELRFYGTNTENDTVNGEFIGSVTLTAANLKDGTTNVYEALTPVIETGYQYFYVTEHNIGNLYISEIAPITKTTITDSTAEECYSVNVTNTLRNPAEITFDIVKTWDDNNNEFQDRPSTIFLDIYGTELESLTTRGTLVETIEITKDTEKNEDNDPNTWEYHVELESIYKSFYVVERINETQENGSYELTTNTINLKTNNIFKTAKKIDPNAEAGIMPAKAAITNIVFKKEWNDYDNALGTRPEYVTINIYQLENYDDPIELGILVDVIRIYEDRFEIIQDNSVDIDWTYPYTDGPWSISGSQDVWAEYSYAYEEVITFGDNYYYSSEVNEDVQGNPFDGGTYTYTYTNTLHETFDYNINLINTYIPDTEPVTFNITKTWDDNNNEYGERPELLTVKIYGTLTEGATSGGRLLVEETIDISKDLSNDNNSNTWEFKTNYIDSAYEYFYVEEILNGTFKLGSYALTVNNISLNTNNVISLSNDDPYGIMPLSGWDFVFNLDKVWNDNNNANGTRPEYFTINAYAENYQTSEQELVSILKVYENRIEEELIKEIDYGMGSVTANLGLDVGSNWSFSGMTEFAEITTFTFEEVPIFVNNGYYQAEMESEMNPIGDVGTHTVTITNTFIPYKEYNVELTNTYTRNEVNYSFNIEKKWNDIGNESIRPESVDIKIYGTNNGQDAQNRTNGILIDTVTITNENKLNDYTWSKYYRTTFRGSYDYYYVIEETTNNYNIIYTDCWLEYDQPNDKVLNIGIINEHKNPPEVYQFKIIKDWIGVTDASKLPESIDINIYGTDSTTKTESLIKTVTLTADNAVSDIKWELISPVILGHYDSFRIEEVNIDGYVSNIGNLIQGKFDASAAYINQEITPNNPNVLGAGIAETIFLNKFWLDNNNIAGERPTNLELEVYYSENKDLTNPVYIQNISIDINDSQGNIWYTEREINDAPYETYVFVKEPETIITENGRYVAYNMKYNEGGYYILGMEFGNQVCLSNVYVPDTNCYTVTITNTKETETEFKVTKLWNDNNNQSNLRPESITVSIYGVNTEGSTTGGTKLTDVVLTDANLIGNNTWEITTDPITTTYKYFYIEEVVDNTRYTVEISPIVGTTVTGNTSEAAYAITLTNTLKQDNIDVTKIWDDEDNFYNTRPTQITIKIYQNGVFFQSVTLNSENKVSGNNNMWRKEDIAVPKYDENGNAYIYTIEEDFNSSLSIYYKNPIYNQETLTVTNRRKWIPIIIIEEEVAGLYDIEIGKEIVRYDGSPTTDADWARMDLDKNSIFKFPIVLKQLNRSISNDNGLIETYEGYSGNEYQGVLTSTGTLKFSNVEPGKYEIYEKEVQWFTLENMEKIKASTGADLTYKDGKYYIIISGISGQEENISIKIINKLDEERPYDNNDNKPNIFKINNLADNNAIAAVSAEMASKEGMSGRLTIPSLGVNVALFEHSSSSSSQSIVDATDSAALLPFGVQTLVADHYYQGFEAIKQAQIGQTIAYVNDGTKITAYICTENKDGTNITSDLLDYDGNSVSTQNAGGLCMYTCNTVIYDGRDIRYTFWKKLN